MYYNEEHAKRVKERGDNYEYIGSYKKCDTTIDGKNKSHKSWYIRVKCPYCNKEYDVGSNSFFNNNTKCKFCCNKYENSLAYYIQVELNEPLNKYWDWENNDINPYLIYKCSHIEIWLKCTNTNYHESYKTSPYRLKCGNGGCPYCHGKKTHKFDSFGYKYPEYSQYWGNNDKTPYEVPPYSHYEYNIKCSKCNKEFRDRLRGKKTRILCSDCNGSKLENKVAFVLNKYNIVYEHQKEFEGLLGVRGGNLSYDFYLPNYNILLECQGEFHDGVAYQLSEKDFIKQQEHDKRKFEYAIKHNYIPLEIWYWDYDNIEEILVRELELHKED